MRKTFLITSIFVALAISGCSFNGNPSSSSTKSSSSQDTSSTSSSSSSKKETLYTVYFDLNGGTSPSYVASKEIHKALDKNEFFFDVTKNGFEFTGWYVNGIQVFDDEGTIINKIDIVNGRTFVAGYIDNSVTVTFNSLGGSAVNPITVEKGQTITKPANPKKESTSQYNYTFDFWHKEGLDTEFNFSTTIDSSFTLYAKWIENINKFTVSYVTNCDTSISPTTNVEYGSKIDEPNPLEKTGYRFDGWYSDSTFVNKWLFDVNTVINNITLYAKWVKVYTVTFNSHEGSSIDSAVVDENSKANKPTDPKRTNYIFGGWFKEEACENLWDFDSDVVTEDVTLHAGWTYAISSFQVSFNTNGGTPSVDSQIIEDGSYASKPEVDLVKEPSDGYTYKFAYWYYEDEDEEFDFTTTPITSSITLNAKWDINTCLVTFYKNDGTSDSYATDQVLYNNKTTNPGIPTYDGHTFMFWAYEDGNEFNFDTTNVTEPLNLFAKWTDTKYLVSFKDIDQTSDISTVEVKHGEKVSEPEDPSKPGYEFLGWYSDSDLLTEFDFEQTTITQATNIYSKWELVFNYTYTVSGTNLTITGISDATQSDFVVPKTITLDNVTYNVVAIGDAAFMDAANMETISLPEGLTTIGKYAFSNSGITEIDVPSTVTSIGDYAFAQCVSFETITFAEDSSLVNLGISVFTEDSALTTVTLPNSLKVISDYAFNGCLALTSVTFGNQTTTIGLYSFGYCPKLNNVVLPDTVTSIGDRAFSRCTNLTTFTNSNGLTHIGKYAFENDASLGVIYVPISVSYIGNYAFYNCSALTINCGASAAQPGWETYWNASNRPVNYNVK